MKHVCKSICLLLLAVAAMACGGNGNGAASIAQVGDSAAVAKPRQADTLSFAVVGDIMMGSTYPVKKFAANDGAELFRDCDSLLRSVDLACGNLEGVLANSGKARKPLGAKGSFSFLMPTRYVNHLVKAGFDFVGVANNHAFDFSEPGVKSTMATLDSAGIAYAGNPHAHGVVKEVRGTRVGFCAFGHSRGTLLHTDAKLVHGIIDSLKREADIVVVCFHGGAEGTSARHLPDKTEFAWGENRGHLRKFAHDCIDWGADLVYGHGPHVPRAMEVYKGHFIAYSMGNFATTGMSTAAQTGYAPLAVLRVLSTTGELIDGQLYGFIQKGTSGPRTDTRGVVISDLRTLSAQDITNNELNIDEKGRLTRK